MSRDQVGKLLSSDTTFLTFAGVETHLLFQQKFPLREFSAFEIFQDEKAWQRLQDEFLWPVADTAAATGMGLITDCLVWRASQDYVAKLGYADDAVPTINRQAVERTREFVGSWQTSSELARETPVIFSADVGPRGDGYAIDSGRAMDADAALAYHRHQMRVLFESEVDLVTALTITSVSEATGIARAAEECGLPLVMSPTVETDGRLPDGASLGSFIEAVDHATDGYPLLYMVNCAHPTHLEPTLMAAAERGDSWIDRFRGFRANASAKSHQELDESTSLDRGDPRSLAGKIAEMKGDYGLKVIGGCCGTDVEHLQAIAERCRPVPSLSH